MIKEGKIYSFTNGTIKLANKKWTTIPNDHCITFNENSCIIEQDDDGKICEGHKYNFRTLEDISETKGEFISDVIGVVIEANDPVQFVVRNSGEIRDRRNVVIADTTGKSIGLTIWGD